MAFKVSILLAFLVFTCSTSAELTTNFYGSNCTNLLRTVQDAVAKAIQKEPRMGASLLRLHFHDCFVNGCDGSILLDDDSKSNFTGEKTAPPNLNSARGFEVVDAIKTAVESSCPGVVSCADILAIAARDSVVNLGGERYEVLLGRKDSLTTSLAAASNGSIPTPTSNLTVLLNSFKAHDLNATDLVLLSGAHTIGQARCTSFRARIYNDTNDIESTFAKTAQQNCPNASGSGDNNLEPLDIQTPKCFDNKYYVNLADKKGLLHSDQQLISGVDSSETASLVDKYMKDPNAFLKDFGNSMIKMGNIITGTDHGEIRKNCRKRN